MKSAALFLVIGTAVVFAGCREDGASKDASDLFNKLTLKEFLNEAESCYVGKPEVLENTRSENKKSGVAHGCLSVEFDGVEDKERLLGSLRDHLTQHVTSRGGMPFPGVISGEKPLCMFFSYSVSGRDGNITSRLYGNILVIHCVEYPARNAQRN